MKIEINISETHDPELTLIYNGREVRPSANQLSTPMINYKLKYTGPKTGLADFSIYEIPVILD